MENIFKFRKSMSVYILGILFIVLFLLHFRDFHSLMIDITSIMNYIKDFGSIFNSIVLVMIIFTGGTLGVAFLNFIVNIFKFTFDKLVSFNWINKIVLKCKNTQAFLPINYFIKEYYQNNKDQILHFFLYRSCSKPENIKQNKVIETLIFTQVGKYYSQNLDTEIIKDFNFHSSLTQEQIKLENNKTNVFTFYYAIINSFAVVNLLIVETNWGLLINTMLYATIVLFIYILSFQIYERKKFMASAIIYGFFDNFTVSDLAEMADREAY